MSINHQKTEQLNVILVTGGSGFIGSNFIRAMLSKHTETTVINIDKLTYAGNTANTEDIEKAFSDRYIFVKGDITDKEFVKSIFARNNNTNTRLQKQAPITAVVNFAAESHVDRSIIDSSPFIKTNVIGTQILGDLSKQYNVAKFLQISTDEVYGDASPNKDFDENSALRPSSPYAASKAAADLLLLSYFRTYHSPVMIARSSNNFGPYQFPEKLIPLIITKAISGETLPIYGAGTQSRDWIYVQDNCEALIQILTDGKNGNIYNISGNHELSNLQMVLTICQILSDKTGIPIDQYSNLIKHVQDRPGHDIRYSCVSKKIMSEIGWQPQKNFIERLEYTVDWYLSSNAWIQRVLDSDYEKYYTRVHTHTWETLPE